VRRLNLAWAAALLLALAGSALASTTSQVRVSHCPGSNAEVDQKVDGRYVYEAWIGCTGGIGFARSTNGGRTFGPTQAVPGSTNGRYHGWDPAVAVAPDGTVYVAYMIDSGRGRTKEMTPGVSVSTNHGRTFSRHKRLPVPAGPPNWGDREYIAVGPNGTVYVTWDYGPRADEVRLLCSHGGSCAYAAGDFNAVVQRSADGGRTWSGLTHISPAYPTGGVYSAPIVAEPDGTLDVLYIRHPTNPSTLKVSAGGEFFTRSTDGGSKWSTPVAVDPGAGKISVPEWWIDGSLAVDPAGNLYAAWDTQGASDVAHLAWSTNGGATWSAPVRVTRSPGENLVEVAAAGRRDVYVAWQTVVRGKGYATFARRYAVGHGWTGRPVRASAAYGATKHWPGDTFGISTDSHKRVLLSWGSAVGGSAFSQIWARAMSLPS
jgi:hypothetical protein